MTVDTATTEAPSAVVVGVFGIMFTSGFIAFFVFVDSHSLYAAYKMFAKNSLNAFKTLKSRIARRKRFLQF